jgi:hypothetical protein
MQDDDRLAAHMRLLKEASIGKLQGLGCPSCRQDSVSVWFTHPGAEIYRTWFLCASCDFNSRALNSSKPDFFLDDRVRQDLEERDAAILRNAIFKMPVDQ